MHRNRLVAGLCAPPLAGFQGWAPGKGKGRGRGKEGGSKGGGRMDTFNFRNVAALLARPPTRVSRIVP